MSGPTAGTGTLVERRGDAGRLSLISPKLEALGIAHGFTTRLGGLNVRTPADLAGPLVDAGCPGPVWIGVQEHGSRVGRPADRQLPADAHFSPPGGDAVAVRTADCLGVLLAGHNGVVAAHAGWRGLLAGVLPAAVAALGGGAGVRAAAVGPAIGPDAFEIGFEVADALASAGLAGQISTAAGSRPHADLAGIALRQLALCGMPPDRVDVAQRCTFAEAGVFYSFRRDGPGRGHQAAWIRPSSHDPNEPCSTRGSENRSARSSARGPEIGGEAVWRL